MMRIRTRRVSQLVGDAGVAVDTETFTHSPPCLSSPSLLCSRRLERHWSSDISALSRAVSVDDLVFHSFVVSGGTSLICAIVSSRCGACWAITAIETVESAVFLATGELYDLSETEVIVCEEECEMCSGGWPQNALDYVMDYGGLPLENDLEYNGDFLLALTQALEGDGGDYE